MGPCAKRSSAGFGPASYSSADEVIRAGLLALEREEAGANEWLTRLAEESLADPEPSIPAEEVFRELRALHEQTLKDSNL